MKLFEIESHIEALDQIIEESGGEITPDQEAALTRLMEDYENQMGWIHGLIKQRDADAKAAKDMEQHFKRKRTAAEASVKWWKSVVMVALTKKNLSKWRTYIGNLTICNNSAVSISMASLTETIPLEYQKITIELDKSYAAERYKELVEEASRDSSVSDPERAAANKMRANYGIVVERGTHVRV